MARKRIELEYRGIAGKNTELQRIDPLVLCSNGNSWYVIAFCHKKKTLAHAIPGLSLIILPENDRI
ncbi:MAG: WYL domain-containing protein [Chitinivibrionales bacterium]|nr:WYL domain-containing protein [Chitinivibrionales bacterium]